MTDVTRSLAVAASVVVFFFGASRSTPAASVEDCRVFHRECTDARAAGYRDVGICNVERRECEAGGEPDVPQPSHEAEQDSGQDPERASGERSIGP